MKINRSSREPGGQASNWRPPGNQNQYQTVTGCYNQTRNQNISGNKCERLVLPSSEEQRDPNQNDNRHKLRRNVVTMRRNVTRLTLFDMTSLTSLLVLSVALFTSAQSVEGNLFFIFFLKEHFINDVIQRFLTLLLLSH